MAVNKDPIGKQWPPVTYQVGREKITEYAAALGIDEKLVDAVLA